MGVGSGGFRVACLQVAQPRLRGPSRRGSATLQAEAPRQAPGKLVTALPPRGGGGGGDGSPSSSLVYLLKKHHEVRPPPAPSPAAALQQLLRPCLHACQAGSRCQQVSSAAGARYPDAILALLRRPLPDGQFLHPPRDLRSILGHAFDRCMRRRIFPTTHTKWDLGSRGGGHGRGFTLSPELASDSGQHPQQGRAGIRVMQGEIRRSSESQPPGSTRSSLEGRALRTGRGGTPARRRSFRGSSAGRVPLLPFGHLTFRALTSRSGMR